MRCILLFLFIYVSMVTSDNFTVNPIPGSSFPATVSPSVSPTVTPSPMPFTPDIPFCYEVVDGKKNPCVNICINQLNVTTVDATNKETTILINAENGVVASGSCPLTPQGAGYKETNITLNWNQTTMRYSLSFSFRLNSKQNSQTVNSADNEWYLSAVNFTNGTDHYTNDTSDVATIAATLGQSYFCASELSIKMAPLNSATKKDTSAILYFRNYTIQAFPDTNNKFGATVNCVAPGLPSYIPIIVGCALAGLVLLVLVVYIIGRCYKSKQGQDGYERLS